MNFLALGINHKTAPIAVREKVAFSPDQQLEALVQLQSLPSVEEVILLSTCNRTEIYCLAYENGHEEITDWIAQYHRLVRQELTHSRYIYWGCDGVRHLTRVACGLDSMVLGEPQILGQVKTAIAQAVDQKSLGKQLQRICNLILSHAKSIRTQTSIGENPVSVAYGAVSLAKHIFADLAASQALLIGAGETMELVAKHLSEQGVNHIVVANRTLTRARDLADTIGAEAVLLSDLADQLVSADIVIASTASQVPILGKGAVERALKIRKHRPIFMVDLAVPRDIEPQVGELDDVYLYSVDDLQEVVADSVRSRQKAADEAELWVEKAVLDFERCQNAQAGIQMIKAYRQSIEILQQDMLAKARQRLEKGEDPEQALEFLARGLANKILHQPVKGLREVSEAGEFEQLELARKLLGISDTPSD